MAPRWDVAGFGEVFVASFVAAGEGSESSLTPFLGEAPSAMSGVVAEEWFAARTTAMSVERLDGDWWAVTVAAALLRRGDAASAAAFVGLGVRFFRVEVVDRGRVLVAVNVPVGFRRDGMMRWTVPGQRVVSRREDSVSARRH